VTASEPESISTWFERLEEAEKDDGWLAWCRDHNLYVAYSRELLDALAQALSQFAGTILELGAGSGELALALRGRAVPVIATDVAPKNPDVIALAAHNALRTYQPSTVLSSFLPVDGRIEAEILRCASVNRYFYIGPIVMERVGPDSLWSVPGWRAESLPEIDSLLISRLDVLADFTRRTHRRGAGAVLLQRIQ
jgi:hypothetical protein